MRNLFPAKFVACGLFITATAFAENWTPVTESSDSEHFLDLESIKTRDGLTYAWLKTSNKNYNEELAKYEDQLRITNKLTIEMFWEDIMAGRKSVRPPLDPPHKPYKYSLLYVAANCDQDLLGIRNRASYDASGNLISSPSVNDALEPVVPGSVGAQWLKKVCTFMPIKKR